MKYHIDTIPIWDAAKLEGECLLCALERRTELGEAERYLGASVMEPDVRIRVNQRGFCRKHHAMLFTMSGQLAGAGFGDRLNGKAKAARESITAEARKIQQMAGTCVMCDTISDNMLRYLHTFFHLYQSDGEFKRRFLEGKGLCIPHLGQLIEVAAEELGTRELGEFVQALARTEKQNLDRIQEDISWFIKKFDYRYEKEDWKNSRDAVERTVNKTRGWCVGKEPNEA